MLSSIRKIFSDKTIRRFELDYRGDYYQLGDREERGITKKDRLIAEIIPDNSSVLDIGCGDGRLLLYLLQTKKNLKVYGIDISESAVEIAKKRGIDAECLDILKQGLPGHPVFDYIIMADFIEHIPEPERLLLRIKDHFRKQLIISIPNTGYITDRLRLMIGGRFPVQWGKHPGEHLRFWTVRDFQWWSDQLGYEVVKIIPVRGPFLKKYIPSLFSRKNIYVLAGK